jgi:hypothetical protein
MGDELEMVGSHAVGNTAQVIERHSFAAVGWDGAELGFVGDSVGVAICAVAEHSAVALGVGVPGPQPACVGLGDMVPEVAIHDLSVTAEAHYA